MKMNTYYSFNTLLDGVSRYIDNEIMSGMNDLQEIVARIAIGRVWDNKDSIRKSLVDNGIIRSLGIIDSDGDVNVDILFGEIKKEIERKGKLTIAIPMFGKITFMPNDVDTLKSYITGEK
jgi:hypothetical protein